MIRHALSDPRTAVSTDRRGGGGFTLIEVIVAFAVLSLLLIIVFQVTSQTGASARAATQKMDAGREARFALDAIGNDLSTFFRDGLTGMIAGRHNDNGAFAFLNRARPEEAAADNARLQGVFYAIVSHPDLAVGPDSYPLLGRGYSTVPWTAPGPANSLSPVPSVALRQIAQAMTGAATTDLQGNQPIAPGVFRLELAYVMNDGTIARDPPEESLPAGAAPALPTGVVNLDLGRVNGLVVTVASLDEQNRKLLVSRNGPAALTTLAGQLVQPPQPGVTAIEFWNLNAIPDSVAPAAVRAAIHVAQKTFSLR